MSEIKLKPCPFCGRNSADMGITDDGEHFVYCMNCGSQGPIVDHPDDDHGIAQARAEWNQRHPLEQDEPDSLWGPIDQPMSQS